MDNWKLPDIKATQELLIESSYLLQTGGAPKISCLTATYNRLTQLKQAILCFCKQSYPNKELIIIAEGTPIYKASVARYINELGRTDIFIEFLTDRNYTLGEVRNIAIDRATGDIICQWDDDDQYHPDRLLCQSIYMMQQKADVCYLTDQLHYFTYNRVIVWEDWTYGGHTQGEWQLIPGTLMMYKDQKYSYPEVGENALKGEDSLFLRSLYNDKDIARLSGAGVLYLYTCHGRNTFSNEHHEGQKGTSFPLAFVREYYHHLLKHIVSYNLLRPCKIITGEGNAFTL